MKNNDNAFYGSSNYFYFGRNDICIYDKSNENNNNNSSTNLTNEYYEGPAG